MSPRTDSQLLQNALDHFERAQEYLRSAADERIVADAAAMRLAAALESLRRVQDSVREKLFADEWPHMWGIRNRIAHGYVSVDHEVVLTTIEREIPDVVTRIQSYLEDEPS